MFTSTYIPIKVEFYRSEKMKQELLILKNYLFKSRLIEIGDYLNFLKIGIEDGWLSSNNRQLQAVYRLADNIKSV